MTLTAPSERVSTPPLGVVGVAPKRRRRGPGDLGETNRALVSPAELRRPRGRIIYWIV
jgi:hypothetical protein